MRACKGEREREGEKDREKKTATTTGKGGGGRKHSCRFGEGIGEAIFWLLHFFNPPSGCGGFIPLSVWRRRGKEGEIADNDTGKKPF